MKYSHEIESFPIMTDIREKRATKVRDGFYEESLRLEDNEELLCSTTETLPVIWVFLE